MGETLLLGTVRASLTLYGVRLAVRMSRGDEARKRSLARAAWTAGAALLAAHVLISLHVAHGWSQMSAWMETARQTAEVTGWNWGGGLYINYVVLTVWLVDAAWWLRNPRSYESRPLWQEFAVQGLLAFIFFNALVVFKTGPTRWAGIALFALLAGMAARTTRRRAAGVELPRESDARERPAL